MNFGDYIDQLISWFLAIPIFKVASRLNHSKLKQCEKLYCYRGLKNNEYKFFLICIIYYSEEQFFS